MKHRYYSLIESQNSVRLTLMLSSHSQAANVPICAYIDKSYDLDLLLRAAKIEAERNDSLRLRLKCGIIEWEQYFVSENESCGSLECCDFKDKTLPEIEEILSADAQKKLDFKHGEMYRIKLFSMPEGKTGIYMNLFHIISDAFGAFVMLEDILSVYESLANDLPLPPPLSSFEEKLQKELELKESNASQYEKEKEFFAQQLKEIDCERFFVSPAGIEKLDRLRAEKKDDTIKSYNIYNPLHSNSQCYYADIAKEQSDRLITFCKEQNVNPIALLLLGYRMYCSAINRRTPFFGILFMLNKRKTKSDKRMSGDLAQTIMFLSQIDENMSFKDAAEYLSNRLLKSYRYSDLSFMDQKSLIDKTYEDSSTVYNSMLYSFTAIPGKTKDGVAYTVKPFCSGHSANPFYVFNIYNENSGIITCRYEHHPAYIPTGKVEILHSNMVRLLMRGISEPDIPIGALLSLVTKETE